MAEAWLRALYASVQFAILAVFPPVFFSLPSLPLPLKIELPRNSKIDGYNSPSLWPFRGSAKC